MIDPIRIQNEAVLAMAEKINTALKRLITVAEYHAAKQKRSDDNKRIS